MTLAHRAKLNFPNIYFDFVENLNSSSGVNFSFENVSGGY